MAWLTIGSAIPIPAPPVLGDWADLAATIITTGAQVGLEERQNYLRQKALENAREAAAELAAAQAAAQQQAMLQALQVAEAQRQAAAQQEAANAAARGYVQIPPGYAPPPPTADPVAGVVATVTQNPLAVVAVLVAIALALAGRR